MKQSRRIIRYLFSRKSTAAALFATAGLTSAATIVSPFLSGIAIDLIRDDGSSDLPALFWVLAGLGVVFLTAAVAQWLMTFFTVRISNATARRLRNDTFGQLHRFPLSFFDTKPHGDVIARITNDIDTLTDGLLQGLSQLLGGSLTLVGSLFFMLILNPTITVIIVILAPFSVLISVFIAKNSRRRFREQALHTGRLTALTEEAVSGLETVRQFDREKDLTDRFQKVNRELYFCGRDAQFYSSLTNPSTRLINNLSYAAIGIFGGLLALKGSLSVGQIAGFLTYAIQFSKPINEMTSVLYQIQAATAAADRIFTLMDHPVMPDDPDDATVLSEVRGAVTAKNVDFSYSPDRKLIRNLNFSISPGQTVAVVGPTGAGKTTLINLLMRFYETDAGKFYLDGIPTDTCTASSLRSSFAMVLQDTWLFKGTVRENIAYGNPEASDAEIKAAADAANADPFIRSLPHGYDTMIREGGCDLSQGQRQMLTIARAMLRPAPLLILDEATSNVDTRTEIRIQEAFLRLMKNKTCFVIAHRLSTIRNADLILVMDKGNVVESGTHESLMKADGLYARMYRQ